MKVSIYSWSHLRGLVLQHRRELVLAHIIAVCAALASVPLPLLLPLLVDEVLLREPGILVATMERIFPAAWQGPVFYIVTILFLTLVLRITALLLGVWQSRQFTLIAKDVTYQMRRDMLLRLRRISMAEYEALGSGTVSSHFVTDLRAIDDFIGASVSRTLVAALNLVGVSTVLIWMHWQLALFILSMNPVVIWFTVLFGKRVKELKQKENSAFELFQQALTETLDAIHQLRASHREDHYLGKVVTHARDIMTSSAKGRQDIALQKLLETTEMRKNTAKYLMSTYPWDFFMIVFTESDKVQHHFWKYMDGHSGPSSNYKDAIKKVYQALDNALHEILHLVDKDTYVFIISDHGAGPSTNKSFFINRWLSSEGLLKFKKSKAGRKLITQVIRPMDGLLKTKLPRGAKEILARTFPQLRSKVESVLSLSQIDWSSIKAYSRENQPTICINLKGREPFGIVEPGDDFDKIRETIIQKLTALTCPETRKKIVEHVSLGKISSGAGKRIKRQTSFLNGKTIDYPQTNQPQFKR